MRKPATRQDSSSTTEDHLADGTLPPSPIARPEVSRFFNAIGSTFGVFPSRLAPQTGRRANCRKRTRLRVMDGQTTFAR